MRKSAGSILVGLLLACCYAPAAMATTWYISPSGDDLAGDGSIGNPWKTLVFATQTVTTPGDIIFVKSGTYLETEQIFLSAGVSLEGDSLNIPVIQSTVNTVFKELLGLKSPEGTDGNQYIRHLKFDGQNMYTYWAIWVAGRSNVTIRDCIIENFNDRGVIFSARSDFYEVPPDSIYSTGNRFYNNIINNCAKYTDTSYGSYGRGCLNIGGQIGMLIHNNVITQNQRPQGDNGWPIKYVNHGYLKNCRIYNNTLNKIPFGGNFPGQDGWDFCIELFNIEGLEIAGNTIHGSIDLNFNHKGSSEYSAWIHHNLISRDTLNSKYESGIIFEFGAESPVIEYNIIRNVSSGIQFNTRDSSIVSNVKIRKNLMANLASGEGTGTSGGILIVSEGTSSAIIDSMEIDNNTIVATTAQDREPWIGIYLDALNHGRATNIKIRNNIIVGFAGAWLKGSDTTTNIDQLHLLVNDPYNNGNNNLPLWPGGLPTNYVDTPYNIPGVDPLFDSSNNSYSLQPISPVIDLGIIIPGIPFLGVGPDLGYAEYGGGPPLASKLDDLYAQERGGKNIVQWSTASENNSNYFDVERASGTGSFHAIGRVNAKGLSTTRQYYSFTDNTPPTGINYYRLAMADKSNRIEFSKIVSVNNKAGRSMQFLYTQLSASGNPAVIRMNSTRKQGAKLVVSDATGRLLFNCDIELQPGINTFTRQVPVYARGIYFIRILTQEETIVTETLAGY